MSAALLSAAQEFIPVLRRRSAEIEAARRLPADLARAFADAGFYRLMVPESCGGLEGDPLLALRLFRTLAEGDGSAGWCVMIGATSGMLAAYMPPDTARDIFAPEKNTIIAGVFAPRGRAEAQDGGYLVSGQWPWGSGSHNAHWICGGCQVQRNGEVERMDNGLPLTRMMMAPAGDVELLDTWDASGLCGSGSTDFAMHGIGVPEERAMTLTAGALLDRPLYRFPVFTLLAVGVASVCLGIARTALDEVIALVQGKTPEGALRPQVGREHTQISIARAEGRLRAANAWLEQSLAAAWEKVRTGAECPLNLRRDIRLACVHGAREAACAVDAAYDLGGGTSVYRRSPLQRCFRDIHTATQHMMVGTGVLQQTGRLFLGLPTDPAFL